MSHADRKKIVFDIFYRKIYSKEIWEPWVMLDYANLDKDQNGYYVPIVKDVDLNSISEKYRNKIARIVEINNRFPNYRVSFSGDADYNLKSMGYDSQTHSLYNFSLIPKNGGINRRKGAKWGFNEQFGVFLGVLEEYFELSIEESKRDFIKEKLCFLGNLKPEYHDTVFDFYLAYFDLFESFDDYCEKVYLVDKETILKIKNIIINEDNVEQMVVNGYWENRKNSIINLYENLKVEFDYKEYLSCDLNKSKYN